jgi:ribulose-phosphate 3-epimerase
MPRPALFDQLRSRAPQLSVGLLTANWMSLSAEIALLERAGVGLLHFDVMDGCFCPMMTLGTPVVAGLKTSMLKDVHLMVEEPLEKVGAFVAAGADIVTIHGESTSHVHRVLQSLRQIANVNEPSRGIVRGLALNPGTPVSSIEPLLGELEMILVLAVNPGWGGQKFLPGTAERVRRVRDIAGDEVLICVDGGVTRDNVGEIARMGADVIVTGSAVFDGQSPAENVRFMTEALR